MDKEGESQLIPIAEANSLCNTFHIIGCENPIAAAIICVNKIIATYNAILPPPGTTYSLPGRYFWQQVKIELQKMERDSK